MLAPPPYSTIYDDWMSVHRGSQHEQDNNSHLCADIVVDIYS